MRSLPRFPAQERFAAASFGTFIFDIFSEIGPNKAVSLSDVEFVEQIRDCPIGILTMNDTKNGLITAIRLCECQILVNGYKRRKGLHAGI